MANSAGHVPIVISTAVLCLSLGAGIAVVTMFFMGFTLPADQMTPEEIQAGSRAAMGMGGPNSGGGGGKMQGKGGTGGPPPGSKGMGGIGAPGASTPRSGKKSGGFRPTSKSQLAMLIAKLDVLTDKPLRVDLTDDQRTKMRDQLKGLLGEDDLSEDDAKDRVDKLLEILHSQRSTLEAAGYRWPGSGSPTQGSTADNPFKEGADAEHLKNLDKRLEKSK